MSSCPGIQFSVPTTITETYHLSSAHCTDVQPRWLQPLVVPPDQDDSAASLLDLVCDRSLSQEAVTTICVAAFRQTLTIQWGSREVPTRRPAVTIALLLPAKYVWEQYRFPPEQEGLRQQLWPTFRDFASRCNVAILNEKSYGLLTLAEDYSFGYWTDSSHVSDSYMFTSRLC